MKLNYLNEEETKIIINKDTESPFTGKFYEHKESGIYKCKQCDNPLYRSDFKFESGCGWPSFDDSIEGSVSQVLDNDGVRVEIICSKCNGHLGHIFRNEHMTSKNIRHCVNSISLGFNAWDDISHKKAYFAGGCFWGIEKNFDGLEGVFSAISGYMGGHTKNPTYEIVCTGNTGHLEVVQVHYDENIISYKELVDLFFKMHNIEQADGQGVDIGSQYLSGVFTSDKNEINIIQNKINDLNNDGYKVATKIYEDSIFYEAEEYHQDYFRKK
jgi:peptide methionine sulfoxide reductase msrA/msrB